MENNSDRALRLRATRLCNDPRAGLDSLRAVFDEVQRRQGLATDPTTWDSSWNQLRDKILQASTRERIASTSARPEEPDEGAGIQEPVGAKVFNSYVQNISPFNGNLEDWFL